MRKILSFIRRKLSVRVSLWVVFFAAVIFTVALGFLFYQSREAVRQEAINRATQILDKTSLRVEGILNRVEVASNMTKWLVESHHDEPDSMFVYSRSILQNNPDFYNCSIAFEPYYFRSKGRYFSAYTKHIADTVRTIQGGSDNYQYFYADWYLMPQLLEKPCWTEPYIDLDVPTNTSEMVTSYCQTFKDKLGQVIGVINISLSISWLSQTISAVKPYPNSYSIMLGRGGTYFVHPDATKITRQTIFTQTLEQPDTTLASLGYAMTSGKEGMKHMNVNGEDSYVFYKPLGQTGCSMAIVCPERDIFSGFDRLRRTILIIVIVGLLLMLYLFIRIISRELKPLGRLAKEAETIASGQFDARMPDFRRTDEIGQLSHSFGNMQQSLVKYIEELKDTTSQKASIESELNIARSIQMSMLPKTFPPFPDCDEVTIYGQLTPAKAVGGDLYDFYSRDKKLFFCIGDVSGKGVPASLVMAVTRTLFRTISAHVEQPELIVSQLNNTIAQENELNMFVTLFVGVIDLPTGHMCYCNAGHDAPLLISKDGRRIGLLPVDSNLPAGVMPGWTFSLQDTTIDKGTTIFLYTDGLNEAENAVHGQFGSDRILETAQAACANGQPSPRTFVEKMVYAVHDFVGEAEQSDDLTMMAIQYNPKTGDSKMRRHSITLPNETEALPKLLRFIEEVSEDAALETSLKESLAKAMEETVAGLMQNAYPEGTKGTVNVVATIDASVLSIVISDSGIGSSEDRNNAPGIGSLRQIVDNVTIEQKNKKNKLTLIKNLN